MVATDSWISFLSVDDAASHDQRLSLPAPGAFCGECRISHRVSLSILQYRGIPDAGVDSPSQRLHSVERRYAAAAVDVPDMFQRRQWWLVRGCVARRQVGHCICRDRSLADAIDADSDLHCLSANRVLETAWENVVGWYGSVVSIVGRCLCPISTAAFLPETRFYPHGHVGHADRRTRDGDIDLDSRIALSDAAVRDRTAPDAGYHHEPAILQLDHDLQSAAVYIPRRRRVMADFHLPLVPTWLTNPQFASFTIMALTFPAGWPSVIVAEFSKDYFRKLQQFVETERKAHQVFPDAGNVYRAFELTPLNKLRVVILGQDPYHDDGQAHGLSFSVRQGIKLPPSLRNIYKELESDLGIAPATHGCLEQWARQGVMLLNSVLTVRAHEANSHRGKGWEEFTSRVLDVIKQRPNVAFVLWGKPAKEIAGIIDDRHLVIESPHPSPLSAYRGFFGSRPFSRINGFLKQNGQPEIQWELSAASSDSAPFDNSSSAT